MSNGKGVTQMKKFLTIALVVASAFAAEGYKVHHQDQNRRRRPMGLRRHGQRQPAPVRFARQLGGSGRSRCRQGGRHHFRTARRSRNRHRQRPRQGIHHQRPVQQRDHFRSEDAGQERRADRRQEPRRGLLRAQDQARVRHQPHRRRRHFHRRQDRRSAEDFPDRRQRRVLPGGRRRQGVRQHRSRPTKWWRSMPPRTK